VKREEIIGAMMQVQAKGEIFWAQFDDAAFFRRAGESWSPAETVRHLTKSTRPVAMALKIPKLFLLFRFGPARRQSQTYDGLVQRYQDWLASGGDSGRFAPAPSVSTDRAAVMHNAAESTRHFIEQLSRWSEKALDRYQLPHPGLGKLTVREMAMFTVYHHRHHRDIAERRYVATAST
jgi:hypothetical protein